MRDTTTDLLSRIESLELELGRLKALAIREPAGTDAATTPTSSEHIGAEPSSRRELLRYGAVALGAAAAAGGLGTSTVEAADGGAVIIGGNNIGTHATILTSTGAPVAFYAVSNDGGYGVVGLAPAGNGVFGVTQITELNYGGVYGLSASGTGPTPGVYGRANSAAAPGVLGRNDAGGNGVRAEVPVEATGDAIALYALNYSTYTGTAPGSGGFAIYGLSAQGHGVVGATAAAGAAAVVGATNRVPGAYAGAFYGPVIVGGNFTVVGGAKSAAVPHPDGSHRRLYCMESPESWFEDFGSAKLNCGEAVVALDKDFAAMVDTGEYHVFLTGYDGRSDLSVCDRTAHGFRVKATAGDVEGTFSWRLVAKRKDIAAPRFEPVEIPLEPAMPPVPPSATATEPPPMPPLPGRPKVKA